MLAIWLVPAVTITLLSGFIVWKKFRTVPDVPANVPDQTALRQTPLGAVVGFADKHQTHAWLGIPYAQVPVGALRWKAPRPPLPWSDVKQALEYGPVAMQFSGATIGSPEREWGRIVGSEDCLSLNVFAPQMLSGQLPQGAERLPVMVWIHGGANTAGTAAAYSTLRNLAGKDQVVVISMNYRLGVFGWFSLAELNEESDTAEDRSGNFGTLDIIAALKWVQQNIAAFGGNPDNVTIFGESAGGLNVYTMLVSPMARGLFHKAILQSPLTVSYSMSQAQNFADDARPGHLLSSRELICKWLSDRGTTRHAVKAAISAMPAQELANTLRNKPAAELLAAITPAALGFYDVPYIFRDGAVMPHIPMQELFKDRNQYNAVPVIIGSNRDEYKIFMSQNPEFVHLYFGKVPVVKNVAHYNRYARYMSDLWKAACVDEPATNMIASGNPDVWVYRFDWDEHPAVPFIQPPLLLGAAHVIEIPFVLRDLDGEFDPFRSATKHNLAGRQQVSDAIAGYWTTFAHTGAPGQGHSGRQNEWLRWTIHFDTDKLMVLDTSAGGGARMINLQLNVDDLKQKLARDLTFEGNPRERIKLYARMFMWSVFADRVGTEEFARFAQDCDATFSPEEFRPAYWP